MDVGNRGLFIGEGLQHLDTVRELHHTVRLLRTALDESKEELKDLRAKVNNQVETETYETTIEKLSIENHILRRRFIDDTSNRDLEQIAERAKDSKQDHMDPEKSEPKDSSEGQAGKQVGIVSSVKEEESKASLVEEEESKKVDEGNVVSKIGTKLEQISISVDKIEDLSATRVCDDDVQPRELERGLSDDADHSCGSEANPDDFLEGKNVAESENDSEEEEVDDIELIFTTEDNKDLGVLQEDLVSFSDNEGWQTSGPQIMVKFQDADSFDETAEIENEAECNREKNNIRTEKIQYNLKTWTHSVFVETDISKCGVVDENEVPGRSPRRNTLPNPLAYQPIIHREALTASKSPIGTSPVSPRPFGTKFFPSNRSPRGTNGYGKSPMRPILVERNSAKRESEAQTDITALPSHWKSESYLAHKVSHNFTTLPSKFALPIQQAPVGKYSLKLSDKTQEARRTLLSDINFTSMVPELSRSADHLCREGRENCINSASGNCKNFPRAHSYMKSTTENLVSPGYFHSRDYGKDMWSPCDCGQSGLMPYGRVRSAWDNYQPAPRYRGSLSSMPSYESAECRRRHSSSTWRDSPEMQRSTSMCQRPSFGSVPSSPTHGARSRSVPFSPSYATSRNDVFPAAPRCGRQPLARARTRNKVTFHESSFRRSGRPGQSLPDLRADFGPESGDSTDSLIDEAEEFLRRSIDSILTGADPARVLSRRRPRRFSDPDPIREFAPPKSAQPFLPRVPRDLKLDHLVKVICGRDRCIVGRVRYVGNVQTGGEPYVGVELPTDAGEGDGSCHGRRYFDCARDHALFVPFKKVVMAWSF